MAGLFAKDVHDDVAIVKEYPSGLVVAFCGYSGEAPFFGLFFYLIGNGLYLPRVYTTTDDKELCKKSESAEVKDKDVLCLFFIGCLGE